VDAGEFVALLGQNGAGKTTLFQLLTGLFVADSGSIWIDGHDVR
jgi:ABC-2 type transport system ATP-binding protein